MRPWVSEVPREYRKWLGDVEPAWMVLEPDFDEKLMGEPPFEGGALHLAVDLTADELAQSVLVQNALVLLGAVAEGDGLKLTARKNLTRSAVAARTSRVWRIRGRVRRLRLRIPPNTADKRLHRQAGHG